MNKSIMMSKGNLRRAIRQDGRDMERGGRSTKLESQPAEHWLFATMRGATLGTLQNDLIAGLTLAAIAIPEQLATARLAGLGPESGLLAFAAGTVGFAIFGANRFMSVGADSTIAPILAGTLALFATAGTPAYAGLAVLLALMVGVILIAAGLLRAGWIADLLSIPVTVGFLAGISVHIIAGQLPALLGLAAPHGDLGPRLAAIVHDIPHAHLVTTLIGLGVFIAIFAAEKISPRIPGALIGLAAAALATWQLGLAARGVRTLGALSASLPAIALPPVEFDDVARLLPLALTVALVCMMQTAAVARSFPSHRNHREAFSRDFLGVGVGNVITACVGAFAVNSSPPRTAVTVESRARSKFAGLAAVLVTVVLVAVAGAVFAHVPEAALAGILIYVGVRIFRVADMASIARKGDGEILLVAAAAALVVLLPVQTGVAFAIGLSLLHSTYLLARPTCVTLVRLPNTTIWWEPSDDEPGEVVPGVLVFSPAAPLTFINADYIAGELDKALAATTDVRLAVIEASGITLIDYTGAQTMIATIVRLRERDIDVVLARLESSRAAGDARRGGLLEALGEGHVFHSVEEAVRALGPHPAA
jgi:SulP family sulfate permease